LHDTRENTNMLVTIFTSYHFLSLRSKYRHDYQLFVTNIDDHSPSTDLSAVSLAAYN